MEDKTLCLKVPKNRANEAIKEAKRRGVFDENYKVFRDAEHVYIPVRADSANLPVEEWELVECSPPRAERREKPKTPSYDLIGDVAIVRSNVLEFLGEDEIVRALTAFHKRLRAIYVKEETVDEFRIPLLRLIWGEPVEEVSVREYGLSFKVRLGKVYFNQRLGEEHHRVASEVSPGETIADLFAGVGGFSIHAASMTYVRVVANDLNPHAYECLLENVRLNKKALKGTVIPFNEDASRIPELVSCRKCFDKVIANLPRKSLDFADVYSELVKPGGVLYLYVLSYDPETTTEEIYRRMGEWRIISSRLVLEYAPRAGIYLFKLVNADNNEPNQQDRFRIPQ